MSASAIRLSVALACIPIALLFGCQTEQPLPETVPDPEPPPVPAPAPPDVAHILEQARLAFAAHRLTSPSENSAFALYQEALRLDPGNDAARRGMEKIVERYVRFALEAIERGQFPRARSMLARARLVDATHPAIEPTEQQMLLVENAERDRIRLDPYRLSKRAATLGQLLYELGTRAKASSCRVLINARSDAEGRWIYQQLNGAPGENRIRARLQVASPPTLELICLNQTD